MMDSTEKQLIVLMLGIGLLYVLAKKATGMIGDTAGNAAASVYNWLNPPLNALGNIVLPDGTLIPIGQVRVAQDANGTTYANYGGHVFRLDPSDANGNWPGTQVS